MNLFDLCVYKNLNKGSGGDVDVSSLVATENKTYNAGEGKAYNPVVVNVPTPPPSLQSLTASHNGYFVPSSGYDGFDEVTVEVATPLETLSATENGTYTPSSGYEGFSEVTVDVPLPNNAYLLESQKDDVVTIQHGAEFDMPKLIASIEPQQDLHGYDSPWVGGAGKNKLPINSLSISGGGITAIIDRDSNNNVVSVTVNGTASGTVYVILNTFTLPSGTYTMSGCPSNGGTDSYRLYDDKHTSWADNGSGASFTLSEASQVAPTIRIANGYTVNNLKFYPMIESGSEKTTFAPYSNECPISGWTACNVVRTGANLWDEEWEVGRIDNTTGENSNGNFIRSKNHIRVQPNEEYYLVLPATINLYYYDKYKNYIGYDSGVANGTKTIPNNCCYVRFFVASTYGTTYNDDISVNYPSTDTTYHAYSGDTDTINFVDGSSPLTVYGGTLNVLSGVLTITDGYISSYNGETLPSTWISDRDVYAEGTTPTTGAEVCYKLATPQTYQLTPTQVVKSLLGVNNIFADTGKVDVQIWTKEVTS